MGWMSATALAGCTITSYLFFRYTWCLSLSLPAKIAAFAACLLVGIFPLLTGYRFEKILGTLFTPYRYALYFVFIFCVIFLYAETKKSGGTGIHTPLFRRKKQQEFHSAPISEGTAAQDSKQPVCLLHTASR